jgi:hypothetical protein
MDKDMDAGWRMGSEFVAQPDRLDRARIVASRLLIALENGNEPMIHAMSSYILAHLPGVRAIYIDTSGEMRNTRFVVGGQAGEGF